MSRYLTAHGAPTDDVQEAGDAIPEEVEAQERAAMRHVLRRTPKTDEGLLVVSEAFSEAMRVSEALELAALMRASLDVDAVEPDLAEIGRVCHGIMARYTRQCAKLDR